jgi:hypothetical protein
MTQWPADQIERRKTASLIPYSANSRRHTDAQIGQIAASIKEWGFTIPILIDEHSLIIAGHARVAAAQQLGLEEVPCLVARGWPEAKKQAYVIADNKLALNSTWDDKMLSAELTKLLDSGYDWQLTGFASTELAALLAEPEDIMSTVGEQGELKTVPVTFLTWGNRRVGLTPKELEQLEELYARHMSQHQGHGTPTINPPAPDPTGKKARRRQVALTEKELEVLERLYDDHLAATGTAFGFIRALFPDLQAEVDAA